MENLAKVSPKISQISQIYTSKKKKLKNHKIFQNLPKSFVEKWQNLLEKK